MTEVIDPKQREQAANDIVKRYMLWSAGLGAIPVPVVDIAAVSLSQVGMIKKLAELYEVPYNENIVKSIIGALCSGTGSHVVAYGSIGQTLKMIPGIGTLFGMVAMPTVSAGAAYALGHLFIQHFETGGTLLDFNAEKMREFFQKQFEEGMKAAKK